VPSAWRERSGLPQKHTYAGGRNAFDGHALVAGPYLALGGAIESPPAGTLDKTDLQAASL
jgi:hypothetical protein